MVFDKVLIFDGSYLLHRSLHIDSVFDLKNSKGIRTGGVFGFLRSLNYEMKENGTYFPIVCFDSGLSRRRVELYPAYKKSDEWNSEETVMTQEEADNDYITQYRTQRNKLVEILEYMGIPCLIFKGWEGDDLMYIISKKSKDSIVITDDRDLLQLLSKNCRVYRPMAKEKWTLDEYLVDKGYKDIYDFVIYKAIMGDGSDNIPSSCKGVGAVTVNGLIEIIKACDNIDIPNDENREQEIRSLCESINVKYRKAYSNLDVDRFKINLELVDLNKVYVDDHTLSSIISTIEGCKGKVDYFKAVRMLGEMEIREFSADTFLEAVSNRYRNLFVKE